MKVATEKVCMYCKNKFVTRYARFCSSRCANTFNWDNRTEKMIQHLDKARKMAHISRLWSKHTEESRKKISLNRKGKMVGKENYKWRGDKVGYNALHTWVQRTLGTPDTCEHCGKSGLSGRQIHWANKSKEYKRDKNDWVRLCAKCHIKYDGHKRWLNYIKPKCFCGDIAIARKLCSYHYNQRQYYATK